MACVCGCCIDDEPDDSGPADGGPWIKELCTDCSVEYLQYMLRYDIERLQTRITCDNYLNSTEEAVANRALEESVGLRDYSVSLD